MAAPPVEKVYGLHEFVAENPDEVSFKVGETVRVVEQDDAYGDGWWQGTNEAGDTGLFPFSYTTLDHDLAMNAKALALSAGGATAAAATSHTASGSEGMQLSDGTTMKSTMADVEQALDELKGKGRAGGTSSPRRRSFQSERTAESVNEYDEEASDDGDQSEYRSRGAARAALAAKAKANATSAADKEKAEDVARKAQAQKLFEEEETRQRELLLQKEAERKEAAAQGNLPDDSQRSKVAPIDGVDMSDDSDSEGSAAGLGDYEHKQDQQTRLHSPLLGAPSNTSPRFLNQSSVEPQPTSQATGEQELLRADNPPDELDDAPEGGEHNGGLSPIAGSTTDHDASAASLRMGGPQQAAPGGPQAAESVPHSAVSGSPMLTQSEGNQASGPANRTSSENVQRRAPSQTDTSSANGTTDVGSTAPTSVLGGRDTPKSVNIPSAASAAVTPAAISSPHTPTSGRPAAPRGDPHEWSVDEVVEWARSRGFDETSIVSKFSEHEISGDVLLEMDINILKEIDIIAFGKRFQVANAIKELKGGVAGAQSPRMAADAPSASSQPLSSPNASADSSQRPAAAASSTAAAAAGANHGLGLGAPMQDTESPSDPTMAHRKVSRGTIITHEPSSSRDVSGHTASSPQGPQQPGLPSGKSLSQLADEALVSMRPQTQQRPGPSGGSPITSPGRRREVPAKASSGPERSSFFSNFGSNRNRKAAPQPPGSANLESEEGRSGGKGTFSKLGFNRLGGRASGGGHGTSSSGSGDFKNQISLPTSGPTYDSAGDTARRSRASQVSNGSHQAGTKLGGYSAAVGAPSPTPGGGHGRQASVGSAGPGAEERAGAGENGSSLREGQSGDGSGPVMERIRPVDLEGWMRKKGERYNTWKPRYLALKGSDLVILRDPSASKIKGYISMKGYRVIADENTNPGKYGFKVLHEREKPHYFSSDDPVLVREWMKGLMKATIGRDHNQPVISSYNNATMSLKDAQLMNPPPRPPSPTSRARMQRARVRENPTELTAKDQAVLMGLQGSQQGGKRHSGQDSADMLLSSPTSAHRPSEHTRGTSITTLSCLASKSPTDLLKSSTPSSPVHHSPHRALSDYHGTHARQRMPSQSVLEQLLHSIEYAQQIVTPQSPTGKQRIHLDTREVPHSGSSSCVVFSRLSEDQPGMSPRALKTAANSASAGCSISPLRIHDHIQDRALSPIRQGPGDLLVVEGVPIAKCSVDPTHASAPFVTSSLADVSQYTADDQNGHVQGPSTTKALSVIKELRKVALRRRPASADGFRRVHRQNWAEPSSLIHRDTEVFGPRRRHPLCDVRSADGTFGQGINDWRHLGAALPAMSQGPRRPFTAVDTIDDAVEEVIPALPGSSASLMSLRPRRRQHRQADTQSSAKLASAIRGRRGSSSSLTEFTGIHFSLWGARGSEEQEQHRPQERPKEKRLLKPRSRSGSLASLSSVISLLKAPGSRADGHVSAAAAVKGGDPSSSPRHDADSIFSSPSSEAKRQGRALSPSRGPPTPDCTTDDQPLEPASLTIPLTLSPTGVHKELDRESHRSQSPFYQGGNDLRHFL